MSSTRRRVAASEAARLTAVVVLPTPPFWFAMAMTRFMADSVLHCRARTAPEARTEPFGVQATRWWLCWPRRSRATWSATALVVRFSRRARSKISVRRTGIPWMSAITCASVAPP